MSQASPSIDLTTTEGGLASLSPRERKSKVAFFSVVALWVALAVVVVLTARLGRSASPERAAAIGMATLGSIAAVLIATFALVRAYGKTNYFSRSVSRFTWCLSLLFTAAILTIL